MARFTRALFVGGVYAKPSTITTMTTIPAGIAGERAYALGIYRQQVAGEVLWGHTGFWNTFSFHIPAKDVTIAGTITLQGRSAVARALLTSAVEAVVK
ncbi:MAG: serine hydrolase [Gemmatimonadetes bacterium]|nr:serine hydrolase [Gemmatimonadota bacterium]